MVPRARNQVGLRLPVIICALSATSTFVFCNQTFHNLSNCLRLNVFSNTMNVWGVTNICICFIVKNLVFVLTINQYLRKLTHINVTCIHRYVCTQQGKVSYCFFSKCGRESIPVAWMNMTSA